MRNTLYVPFLLLLVSSLAYAAKKIEGKKEESQDVTNKAMTDMSMDADDQDMMSDKDSDDDTTEKTYNLEEVMNECNESFRIEMGYLDAFNASGSFPDETDKTPKCYVRCVLERLNVASEEGTFDASRASEILVVMRAGTPASKSRYEGIASRCTDRKESCKCERSYQFLKCFIENDIMSKTL